MIRLYFPLFLIFFWPTYIIIGNVELARTLYGIYIPLVLLLFGLIFYKVDEILVPKVSMIFLLVNVVYIFVFMFGLEFADERRLFLPIKSFTQCLFFVVCFNLIYDTLKKYEPSRLCNAMNLFCFFQCIVMIVQLFVTDFVLFKPFTAAGYVSYIGIRPPGTFEWGYATSFVLSFFACLNFGLFLVDRKKWRLPFLLLILFCVLITQSKSGLFSVVVAVVYFSIYCFINKIVNRKFLIWMSISLLISIGIGLVIFINIYGYEIFDIFVRFFNIVFSDGELDGSTGTRLRQALMAINIGLEYWHSGFPGSYDYIIENAYFDYLYRYGLIGLVYYVLLTYLFYIISMRLCGAIISKVNPHLVIVAASVHAISLSFFVTSLSSLPFDGYKQSLWCAFLLSIITAIYFLGKNDERTFFICDR